MKKITRNHKHEHVTMNNPIQYILICLLLVLSIPIHALDNKAQTNPSVQILQPSSEAQSLGNFAEIPVDLYTGRTNINIPLFTISYNDIEVPISLSYHGGGIKVDEEAGAVGLGWTLNASGVVNRIVRGMPDELYDAGEAAGYNRLDELMVSGSPYNEYRSFITMIMDKPKDTDPNGMIWNSTLQEKELLLWMQNYGMLYDEGHFDVSPDNYIFSVQGISGAFVNGHTSKKQSNVGCIIRPISDGFQITDVNGLTYSFRNTEKQYYPYKVMPNLWDANWNDIPQDKFLYTSAWWLTSIKSTAGDSVNFYYQTIKKRRRTSNFYAYTQYIDIAEGRKDQYDCNFIAPHNHFMDTVHHQHTLLTQICTSNYRLVFHYSDTTSQVNNACLVDSISKYAISAESGTTREELVERYKFEYSGISNRAKLISLIRQGRFGNTQRYDFTYYSSITPDEDEKDHWGYYAEGSKGTFPNMNYLNLTPQKLPLNKASSRHANNEYADNNMLASIVYPSGLIAKLTWEPHDFSKWSQVGEKAYKEYAYNERLPMIYDTIIKNQFELSGKINLECLSQSLYLDTNNYIEVDLLHYFYGPDVWRIMDCVMNWRQLYPADDLPRFSILLNGHEIYHTDLDSINVRPNIVQSQICNLVQNNGSGYYTFKLSNPRSTLRSQYSDLCGLYHDMFNMPETALGKIPITIFEVNARTNLTDERNVGGVRIKSIEYRQGTSMLLRKEYSYVDTAGISTGVLSYPPRYASSHKVSLTTFENNDMGGADATLNDEPYALFLRSEGLPYALNSGGHIEYEQVNEVITSKHASGSSYNSMNRTEYYYCTSATPGCSDIDDTKYAELIPTDMLQLTSQKHQRGHLWKKVEYTDESKTTIYTYKVLENQEMLFFTGALFPIADFREFKFNIENGDTTINAYKNFGIVKYRVLPYNKRLISQQTAGDKTNIYHSYTYANNTYSSALNADLPITHSYVTSEGDTLVDHMTYMNNTNRITQCITKKHGLVVAGYELTYDSLLRVAEKRIARINPTNPTSINDTIHWETIEVYKYCNRFNKLLEVQNRETNIATTYLWSYYGQFPIAEIINATLDEVKTKIPENQIVTLQETYAPDMSIINNLRTLLPQAIINTMTYDPVVGMTSYTDAKGYTQYYTYDDFGQLCEVYEIVGETKNILKHYEYQISNR